MVVVKTTKSGIISRDLLKNKNAPEMAIHSKMEKALLQEKDDKVFEALLIAYNYFRVSQPHLVLVSFECNISSVKHYRS